MQEFCDGGTLENPGAEAGNDIAPPSPEWISNLHPAMSAALHYLHEQEIIHRDVKPANIYQHRPRHQALVLGDFDISSVLEGSRTLRDTQRTAGTWYYTAPEAFPRFCSTTAPAGGAGASDAQQRLLLARHHHHRTVARCHQPAPVPIA